MDDQKEILDKFRGEGWSAIGQGNCLTLSITFATPEEAQQLYKQLYPAQNHRNPVTGRARRVIGAPRAKKNSARPGPSNLKLLKLRRCRLAFSLIEISLFYR